MKAAYQIHLLIVLMPVEHHRLRLRKAVGVLSHDKYGGAALDAAQDMVLYLRNEIAVLKEEVVKARVENMGLKERYLKKQTKMLWT